MSDNWLRPEFEGRESELETREGFEGRTGVSAMSLSSYFTRYADDVPDVVKMFGKEKYFVAAELDDFLTLIRQKSGSRTPAEVRAAEVARLEKSVSNGEKRLADRERDAEKARIDLAKFRRQLKRAKEELDLVERGTQ